VTRTTTPPTPSPPSPPSTASGLLSHDAYDRARDLPEPEWNALAGPSDLFLGTRWLRVAENASGVPMRYFLFRRDDGVPVAAVPTALADTSVPWIHGRLDTVLTNSAQAGLDDAAAQLARHSSPEALMPSISAGGRHSGNTRVLTAPDITPDELDRVLATVEEHAVAAGAASVAYLHVDESDTLLRRAFHERGYASFATGHYSRLPVAPDFDAYLSQLPSKRRVSIRAERRRIKESGVETRVESGIPEQLLPRMAELETALLRKYDIAWRPELSADGLRQMRDVFADDLICLTASADDQIRGFVLIIPHGDHWYIRQAGFDYPFQQRHRLALYYELCFYRPL
jgi:predicted N-acyltransferase